MARVGMVGKVTPQIYLNGFSDFAPLALGSMVKVYVPPGNL